jgi:hypothetical protein
LARAPPALPLASDCSALVLAGRFAPLSVMVTSTEALLTIRSQKHVDSASGDRLSYRSMIVGSRRWGSVSLVRSVGSTGGMGRLTLGSQ